MNYSQYKFSLMFEGSFPIKLLPTIPIRNYLERKLYHVTCIMKQMECESCPISERCIYSYLFNSFLKDDESNITGLVKPHPFVLQAEYEANNKLKDMVLTITLLGEARRYFTYLYFALSEIGSRGIFKERIKFSISSIFLNSKELPLNEEMVSDLEIPDVTWSFPEKDVVDEKLSKVRIEFLSPVRIQKGGKLLHRIKYEDILTLGYHRLKLLDIFYGKHKGKEINLKKYLDGVKKIESVQKIHSFKYYSKVQQRNVYLVGVLGFLVIEKKFSLFEKAILEGVEIFGIGKMTSFGLGKINSNFI